jgi:hypothetical protein
VTESEALQAILDTAPFTRIQAAQWLAEHASPEARLPLTNALNRETVPQVRRHLNEALARAMGSGGPAPAPSTGGVNTSDRELLIYLGGLIHHETEPAVGWLRLAAEEEIRDFADSETSSAIETLRRRINGVAAIARVNKPPEIRRVSLSGLVEAEVPRSSSRARAVTFASLEGEDDIDTDPDLMSTMLGNAIVNGLHAATKAGVLEADAVVIEAGISDRDFWITLTNRFAGSSFEMSEMGGIGTSTKTGGRGLGLLAMRTAAERLGYFINVSGAGGIATTAIRGPRRHA